MAVGSGKTLAIAVAVRREEEALLRVLPACRTTEKAGFRFHATDLSGLRLVIAVLGMGPARAREGTRELIALHTPSAVVSMGYAGGVDPQLGRGHAVVGSVVSFEGEERPLPSEAGLVDSVSRELEAAAVPCSIGKIMTVSEPLLSVREKKSFKDRHQCLAVDMESAAVAEECAVRKIPFLTVRVILDAAGDELSVNPAEISHKGRISVLRVALSLIRHPRRVPALMGLLSAWRAADRSLARVVSSIIRVVKADL